MEKLLEDGQAPGQVIPDTQERHLYDQAVTSLAMMTPREVYDALCAQSPYIRQVYLVAEEDGQHRDSILSLFPPPDQTVRESIHGN